MPLNGFVNEQKLTIARRSSTRRVEQHGGGWDGKEAAPQGASMSSASAVISSGFTRTDSWRVPRGCSSRSWWSPGGREKSRWGPTSPSGFPSSQAWAQGTTRNCSVPARCVDAEGRTDVAARSPSPAVATPLPGATAATCCRFPGETSPDAGGGAAPSAADAAGAPLPGTAGPSCASPAAPPPAPVATPTRGG